MTKGIRLAPALALLAGPVAPARAAEPRPTAAVYEALKASLFTVEVLPVSGQEKSSLGSGYVVSRPGRIVTNYHVVGGYVEAPDRYRLRVRNHTGVFEVRLLGFDLINDLALLEAPVGAPPLKLAGNVGRTGSRVIAFGNPEGLGLSLVEGIFNGFAARGFVDRLLLSMPLNPGMSGGPILNADGEVIGTNVSVLWRSNSLSFGVPVGKTSALLTRPPVETSSEQLLAETNRQLGQLEALAEDKALKPFLHHDGTMVSVGGARIPRLPEAFECWNRSQEHEQEGITKTTYECNLQFTPSLESLGEIASIEVLAEHFASRSSRFGFYGQLSDHARSHHGVEPRVPGNGVLSAPQCVNERVKGGALTWKVSTCVYAYVKHPGYGYFGLVATSVSRPREAAFVAVHGRGIGVDSFAGLARLLLQRIRLEP